MGAGVGGVGPLQLSPGPLQGMQLMGTIPSLVSVQPSTPPAQPWWWQAAPPGYTPDSPYLPLTSVGDALPLPFAAEQHMGQGGGGYGVQPGAGGQGQARGDRNRTRQQATPQQQHQQQLQQQQQQDMELLSIVGVNALQPFTPDPPMPPPRATRERLPSARTALQRFTSESSQGSNCAAAAADWLAAPPGPGLGGYGVQAAVERFAEGTQSMLDLLLARMGDHAATLAALRLDGRGLEAQDSGRDQEQGEEEGGEEAGEGAGAPGRYGQYGHYGQFRRGLESSACSEADMGAAAFVYEMLPGMVSEGMGVGMGEADQEEEEEQGAMEEGADGYGGDGTDDTFDPMYFHAYGPMGHPMHGSAVSAVHYYLHDACGPGGSSLGGGYEPTADSMQRGGAGAASGSSAAYPHTHGTGSHSHHGHAHAQHQAHHHHHQHHQHHAHTRPYMHDAYLSMQLPGMVDFESAYSQPSLPLGGGLALMRQPSRPSLSRLSDRERYMSGSGDAEGGSGPEGGQHPSLQQLLAAHHSPSFVLERNSGGGGHVALDGLSFAASAAAQQGALTHKGCRV